MSKVLKLTCRKLWCLSTCKKWTSSLTSFQRYCKDIKKNCYFVILSNLGMACDIHLNDSINLRKSLTFICRHKISFILHIFLELLFYCKDIVNLLWVLWACLAMKNKSDIIKWYIENFRVWLQEYQSTSSSILCWRLPAFWPITRETEFYQIWDWWWNINHNISFHFRFFLKKLKFSKLFIRKLFKKSEKLLKKKIIDRRTHVQQWFYRTLRNIEIVKP